jgi:DNA polymerase-4
MVEFSPIILHVDMDAFFAAIEIRNNPSLKGKPVMVGGGINARGVVSTCSYEARTYGVHSGMSTAKAQRLCPEGIFVSGSLKGYVYASACLQKIFEKYTPIVEPCSVDEAFLDITGTERLHGGAIQLVKSLKKEISEQLGLTCSAGIAPSKYLAKMASGLNKPDGMTVMDRERFKHVFFPQPVDALWGIGESTKKTLAEKGILTVEDLARTDSKFLKRIFGKNGFGLSAMSRGEDDSRVHKYPEMPHDKSMSHETTLKSDILDPSLIKATILWLSDKVARRMRKSGYIGRTISVKVRSSDFHTITRSHTIPRPTDRCDIIFHNAVRLVPKEYGMKTRVRLLGVRVSHLKKIRFDSDEDEARSDVDNDNCCQLELIEDVTETEINRLTEAVDAIRDKYGEHSIKLAGTIRSF